MNEWLMSNSSAILTGFFGVLGGLLGSCLTIRHEDKKRKQELISRAKPIIINYREKISQSDDSVIRCYFRSEGHTDKAIVGVFKNTDNGILFLDCVQSENKVYMPDDNTAVDRNTVFCCYLCNLDGESLKDIKIFFHDKYGNKYFYPARYLASSKTISKLSIEGSLPLPVKE